MRIRHRLLRHPNLLRRAQKQQRTWVITRLLLAHSHDQQTPDAIEETRVFTEYRYCG